jgi:hypothetical protein
MSTTDRRAEFAGVPWQQGALLITATTRRWSQEERDRTHQVEQCAAFAHFSGADEGRSRKFVYRYDTPQACAAAVAEHNAELERRRREAAAA